MEDLVKVRGMDRIRLDNVARFLTTETCDEDDDTPRPSVLTNGFHSSSYFDRKPNGGVLNLPLTNGLSTSSLLDIFELLSAYSPRPIIEEVFNFSRKGEPAVRIASWNLHDFSAEKAGNPGVREVICRTILENG